MGINLGTLIATIPFFRGVPYGLAVRIPGFHPGGPGSTPGMGISDFFYPSNDMIGEIFLRLSEDSGTQKKAKMLRNFNWILCFKYIDLLNI